MTDSPCKDCPDRKSGCHTVCERYKEFKEQTHEEYVQRFRENEIESYEIRRGRRLFNGKRSKK
jgi:hypothetical protein